MMIKRGYCWWCILLVMAGVGPVSAAEVSRVVVQDYVAGVRGLAPGGGREPAGGPQRLRRAPRGSHPCRPPPVRRAR